MQYTIFSVGTNGWHSVRPVDIFVWLLPWILAIRCVSVDCVVPTFRSVWTFVAVHCAATPLRCFVRMRTYTKSAIEWVRWPINSSRRQRIQLGNRDRNIVAVPWLRPNRRTPESLSTVTRWASRSANRMSPCVRWWIPNPDRSLRCLQIDKLWMTFHSPLPSHSVLTINPKDADQFEYAQNEDQHSATVCINQRHHPLATLQAWKHIQSAIAFPNQKKSALNYRCQIDETAHKAQQWCNRCNSSIFQVRKLVTQNRTQAILQTDHRPNAQSE